jgi:PAS domain S-box-containing protein
MTMLESSLAAPLHFTLEFAGFVVATGAVVLVATRPALLPGGAIGRFTAAAGFAMLAISGVIHGASFAPSDTDVALIALRTVGWLIVGLAVAGTAPIAASSALIATGEPSLYAPAGAALLAGIAAVLRARSIPALNRLAVAGALTATAEALIAIAPNTVIEGGSESGLAYAAHVLRFGGYLALASWLWTAVRTSVRSRFVAAFAALLVIVVLALSTTLTAVISNNIESEGLARVETQVAAAIADIEQMESDVSEAITTLGGSVDIRKAFASSELLGDTADNLVHNEVIDFDFVGMLPEGGQPVFSGNGPAVDVEQEMSLGPVHRAAIRDSSAVSGARQNGLPSVGVTALNDGSVAIVGATPVTHSQGNRLIGIAVAGQYLDASSVEVIGTRFEPAIATLLVGDQVVATGLDAPLEVPSDIVNVEEGSVVSRLQRIGDESFFSAFAPLRSKGGNATLALTSPSDIVANTRRDLTTAMFLAALAVGAVALLLAWVSGKRITRPIQGLTATAHAVRAGDLGARAAVSGEDEVGQLGATFNDMTSALVRMTQEEQALRTRIETIIQSMADGLVAVDADRRVLAFNIEAELLTGMRAEDALGRSVDDVLSVRDARGASVRLPIHNLTEGAVGDVYIARRYGAPVPVAITTAVLRDENTDAVGGVAVIRDMSREHELDKLKGEFLSNISHELRTPLTPIKGYAQILTRSSLPEEKLAQFAKGILESTQKLERIVALLVDYSQIEAGRLAPRTSSVDMKSMLETLAEEWKGRAPRHDFQTTVSTDLPKASGDQRLLKRTLEEILDNAVKFSPDGGAVRLEARRGRNGSDGSTLVEVSISDDGIGIRPEDLPTIFSDFHQLDSSETRTYGGLGLGLAFVQRIIQAHHGEVRVDSQPDRGTRLTIAIPAVGEPRVQN